MSRHTLQLLAVALLVPLAGCSESPSSRDGTPGVQDAATSADDTAGSAETPAGPFITITSPAAGAQWQVGSAQKIEWQTSLEDVAISYSTDNGATWNKISDSVDTMSPDWLSFPWTIPAEPTEQALIEIKGYSGEIPTRSEVFSIVE